jgi:hypothetical protein
VTPDQISAAASVFLLQFSRDLLCVDDGVKETSMDDLSLLHTVKTPGLLLSLVTQYSSQIVILIVFVIQIDPPRAIGVAAGNPPNLCILRYCELCWLRFHRCFRSLGDVVLDCLLTFVGITMYEHQQSGEDKYRCAESESRRRGKM